MSGTGRGGRDGGVRNGTVGRTPDPRTTGTGTGTGTGTARRPDDAGVAESVRSLAAGPSRLAVGTAGVAVWGATVAVLAELASPFVFVGAVLTAGLLAGTVAGVGGREEDPADATIAAVGAGTLAGLATVAVVPQWSLLRLLFEGAGGLPVVIVLTVHLTSAAAVLSIVVAGVRRRVGGGRGGVGRGIARD